MTQKEVNQMVLAKLEAIGTDVKRYMECNEQEHEQIRESIYKTRYGFIGSIIGTFATFAGVIFLVIKLMVK